MCTVYVCILNSSIIRTIFNAYFWFLQSSAINTNYLSSKQRHVVLEVDLYYNYLIFCNDQNGPNFQRIRTIKKMSWLHDCSFTISNPTLDGWIPDCWFLGKKEWSGFQVLDPHDWDFGHIFVLIQVSEIRKENFELEWWYILLVIIN